MPQSGSHPGNSTPPIPARVRVVAIGGGTGLSTLLRGLKHYVALPPHAADSEAWISDLAGVVTVSDDGGSSGRLRRDMNMLAPGDVRNCLVAVSEDEALLSQLFQYRFGNVPGLEGHSLGNLFLAALTAIKGDFSEAVKAASGLLASRGQIIPSTASNVQLDALMDDGSRVRGETNISASQRGIVELRLVPGNAQPLPETLEAIRRADLITLGPGSLYTSLIANVIVRPMAGAIAESPAVKVFICNLMTQANESLAMTAADHIEAVTCHARRKIFDYALVNVAPVSETAIANYRAEGAEPVICDAERIESMGVRCICADFLEESGLVRHATGRVAQALREIASRHVAQEKYNRPAPALP